MQKIGVSEQPVIDGARELARALGASKVFRDYEHALEKYQSDPSAADLLERLRRLKQNPSMQEMLWGNPGSDWGEQLASLQQQVDAHPAIRALQESETELVDLLFGIVLRLGESTGIDYAEACTGRGLSNCGPTRSSEQFAAALRNSPEVTTAIETVVRSIRATEEYDRFEAARQKFQHDPEVLRVRKEVKAIIDSYIRAQENGTVTVETIQKVRNAQMSLGGHPVVQDLSGKRQQVHNLFQTVNQTIGEVLGLDLAQAVAPASGCCG